MAKRRSLDSTLEALSRLRNQLQENPASDEILNELRRVIGSKESIAVARAAAIAGEYELGELASELETAFDRFMVDPIKTDKNCRAKAEIAQALYGIGHDAEDLFLRGIRHVQKEPAWGGSVDTACALRGACAMGLVRTGHQDVLVELADLLADPQASARTAAVHAMAYSEQDQCVPLLRYKALTGDDDLGVTAECLHALLRLAPESSLAFVAQFLKNRDESTQEIAALALGDSRRTSAFALLKAWWEQLRRADTRRTGLLAIGMLGQDEAFAFLLTLIRDADPETASSAVAALEVYLGDEKMLARVRTAAEKRTDLRMSETIAEKLRQV